MSVCVCACVGVAGFSSESPVLLSAPPQTRPTESILHMYIQAHTRHRRMRHPRTIRHGSPFSDTTTRHSGLHISSSRCQKNTPRRFNHRPASSQAATPLKAASHLIDLRPHKSRVMFKLFELLPARSRYLFEIRLSFDCFD